MNLATYRTLVFDCDGVVLNSNRVKTNAFYNAALAYGEEAASQLKHYHVQHGGVSRYLKFKWFLENVVPNKAGPGQDELLAVYAAEVRKGLISCEVAEGLRDLRAQTPDTRWLIVSGGDQTELNEIFATRGLAGLFDGGIYGSPDDKNVILERELRRGNIATPALFLGDSKYDYEAATAASLDFLFLKEWSEVTNLDLWLAENAIESTAAVRDLLDA